MDIDNNSSIEQSYEAQCNNLRKQISILQDKISYYKKDNAINNTKLTQHIKYVEERIVYMQRENELYEKRIQEMDFAINERDAKISSLEITINDLKEKAAFEKNEILATMSTEKDTITTTNDNLMQEVFSLKNMIVKIKEENDKLNKELMKTKEELKLYDQDNTILLQKIQEYEENNNVLTNEKSQMEINYHQKNNECIQNEKMMINNDSDLNEYTLQISKELNTITQWTDTYLGISYPVQYDVPNLLNSALSASSFIVPIIGNDILSLKRALENAKGRILNEQHHLESNINKQKNDINELVIGREKKQYEIINLRTNLIELKEKLHMLQEDNENYVSEHFENKTMLTKFHDSIETISNNNDQYLRDIIVSIKNEIEDIIKDPLMKSYQSIFVTHTPSIKASVGLNAVQLAFEDLIDRLLHFIILIKDDMKEIKKGNELLSSESLSTKSNWLKELNELNCNISVLKKELTLLESALSQVKDENNLLISEISILENTLYAKEETISKLRRDTIDKKH